MAYTINKSDGSILGGVPANTEYTPGTPLAGTGSTLDLTMYGRGRLAWGERVNENFVHLLENFSSASSPTDPLSGQLWYDNSGDEFNYWDGSAWQPLVSVGGTVSICFDIPDSGLPADSEGVKWVGNTDQARIYVQEESPETSIWVFEVADNRADDFISFRFQHTGDAFPQEMMRLTGDNTLIMGAYDGTVAPPTSKDYSDFLGRDRLIFNEGQGNVLVGPDIRAQAQMFLACNANMSFMLNHDGLSGGSFRFVSGEGGTGTLDGSEQILCQISTSVFRWNGPGTGAGDPYFEIDESGSNMDLRLGEATGGTGSSRAMAKHTDGRLRINRAGDFSVVELGSDLDMDNNDILNVGDIQVDSITSGGTGDYLRFVPLDVSTSLSDTNGSQTVNLNSVAGVPDDAVLVHLSIRFDNDGGGDNTPWLDLRTRQNGSREWTLVGYEEGPDQSVKEAGFVVEKVGNEGGGGDASIRLYTESDNDVDNIIFRVHGYWI